MGLVPSQPIANIRPDLDSVVTMTTTNTAANEESSELSSSEDDEDSSDLSSSDTESSEDEAEMPSIIDDPTAVKPAPKKNHKQIVNNLNDEDDEDDENDKALIRLQKQSLFGFQVRDRKKGKNGEKESSIVGDQGEDHLPKPKRISGKGKYGSQSQGSESGSENEDKEVINDKNLRDEEECPPDEIVVIGTNGQQTKMITTVSGQIKLDFNNTKIIKDGKVIDPNDLNSVSSIQDI